MITVRVVSKPLARGELVVFQFRHYGLGGTGSLPTRVGPRVGKSPVPFTKQG